MNCIVSFLLIVGVANAQLKVVPVNITYETPQPVSVNGSSEMGHCFNGGPTCFEPTTSVLYDGEIPPLYGLDRHQWAAQLLTLNASGKLATLTFDFTGQRGYEGVKGVEVVLFNCPEWGIAVGHILLQHRNALNESRKFLSGFTIFLNLTSCDSFVKVGMPFSLSDTILSLAFVNSSWVHLAEVTFYTEYNQTSNIDLIFSNTFTTNEPSENVTFATDTPSNNYVMILIIGPTSVVVLLIAIILLLVIVLGCLRHKSRKTTLIKNVYTATAESNQLPPLYAEIDATTPKNRAQDGNGKNNRALEDSPLYAEIGDAFPQDCSKKHVFSLQANEAYMSNVAALKNDADEMTYV